jgi:micrococcal nuclease
MTLYKHATKVGLLLVCLATSSVAKPPAPFTGEVCHVSDGDTIHVERGDYEVTVRLRYVDAPEIAHNKRQKDQPGGREAATYLREKYEGKTVHVTPKGESYGRIVADVETDAGKDIALDLVRMGHAQLDQRYKPPKALRDAELAAKKRKAGIWAADTEPVAPWTWRKQQRERVK